MRSAMPAYAIRRERKKSKTGRGPPSRQGSATSLARTRSLNQMRRDGSYYRGRGGTYDFVDYELKKKLRYLVYSGTICLTTGLITLFIGVGMNISSTQRIGLIFIALGSILCIVKVVISEKHALRTVRKPIIRETSADEQMALRIGHANHVLHADDSHPSTPTPTPVGDQPRDETIIEIIKMTEEEAYGPDRGHHSEQPSNSSPAPELISLINGATVTGDGHGSRP